MSVATAQAPTFIPGTQAKRILGTGWYALQKAALIGQVRTQALPGQTLRYCLQDVERIAHENTRPVAQPAGA